MTYTTVLFVGRSDLAAGLDCASVLGNVALTCQVDHVVDMTAAFEYLQSREQPVELVVLCESRRGQYSTESIDTLRSASPLLRFWRVLGSWHEGEPRSGRPLAGCVSTYWHQWPTRAGRALGTNDGVAAWQLPLTTSADERIQAESTEPIEQRSGTVIVSANRFESATALADVCRLGGYDALMVRDSEIGNVEDAVAVLWDTALDELREQTYVDKLRAGAGGAPIVAVMGFPRPDDVRHAMQAGVAAVVSKPYLVRDLLWQIRHVAEER